MVYFDHAAKSPMTVAAMESYLNAAKEFPGNPGSLHDVGVQAAKLLTFCREKLAEALGCNPNELIFTSGGTESNQLALNTLIQQLPPDRREVLVSPLEHPSIHQVLAGRSDIQLKVLPLDRQGVISPLQLSQYLTPKTGLVVVQSVNSVTGILQPVTELATLARKNGSFFHCDHVQGLGKISLPQQVTTWSASAHKFGGPVGCGLLFIDRKAGVLPLLKEVHQEGGYRAGTEDLPAIAAMTTALLKTLADQDKNLAKYRRFTEALRQAFPDSDLFPVSPCYPGICGFYVPSIKGETVLLQLSEAGFYVATTSACNTHRRVDSALVALGLAEAGEHYLRISFGPEHREGDIAALIGALKKIL